MVNFVLHFTQLCMAKLGKMKDECMAKLVHTQTQICACLNVAELSVV